MVDRISKGARRELVVAIGERYRSARRTEKQCILDEFVAVTGYHRKHAVRVLNTPPATPWRSAIAPRIYDEAVQQALIVLWEASDRVCGKRLKVLLPLLIQSLEQHGHLQLESLVRERLLSISAATIDRALRKTRGVAGRRGRKIARAAPAVRQSVPVRTFADWNEPAPGFLEADLVLHCGGNVSGSFTQTLVLTDIASEWTECVGLLVRESGLIVEALEQLRRAMPFPLRGIDTDNGSEFVNDALVAYCQEHGIEFTRSRPYRKNDQAWVEQKNGAVVRRLVGHGRLEGIAAVKALQRLYAASRLYVNFFQPSFKLAERTRVGSRIHKRYLPPETPCSRLLASDHVTARAKARLRSLAGSLDPLRLLDEIRAMQHHLAELAAGQTPHTAPQQDSNLEQFMKSLATAWRDGEARPTHRARTKRRRDWRTRPDPFEGVWSGVERWLEAEPDRTAKELFARLQEEHPGRFPNGQLRTLQRRVKTWRNAAARRLLFAMDESTDGAPSPGDQLGERPAEALRSPSGLSTGSSRAPLPEHLARSSRCLDRMVAPRTAEAGNIPQ